MAKGFEIRKLEPVSWLYDHECPKRMGLFIKARVQVYLNLDIK